MSPRKQPVFLLILLMLLDIAAGTAEDDYNYYNYNYQNPPPYNTGDQPTYNAYGPGNNAYNNNPYYNPGDTDYNAGSDNVPGYQPGQPGANNPDYLPPDYELPQGNPDNAAPGDTADQVPHNGYPDNRYPATRNPLGPGNVGPNPGAPPSGLSGRYDGVCDIYPMDPHVKDKVRHLLETGTHFIKYKFVLPEYGDRRPLMNNASVYFKLDEWNRVSSKHGKSLLSLAFNFDILSFTLLTYGVEDLEIKLVDSPPMCINNLPEVRQLKTMRKLLLNDFDVVEEHARTNPVATAHWTEDEDFLCHQVIVPDDDRATFGQECCTIVHNPNEPRNPSVKCMKHVSSDWVDYLHILLAIIKLLLVFFGPIYLQKLLFRGSIDKADYVVPVEPLGGAFKKTMLVKRVNMVDDSLVSNQSQQKEMKQFRKFRRLVKPIPSDEIVTVTFKKLHINVDHKKLISEKNVPVGVCRFLYDMILRCGICRIQPLASCCSQSIWGSWGPKFLWFDILKASDCNKSCRKFMSWGHIVRFIGFFVLMAAIPLPFYIRMICYYLYEEPEIEDRLDAIEAQNLSVPLNHNVFQYVTPTHAAFIVMYVIYILSFILLGLIRHCDKEKMESIIYDAVSDMRRISYLECIRMLLAHLLLPFEKFGICGVFIAALYWPIALPICVFVFICYSIPALYLCGRFMIHSRPDFIRLRPYPTPPNHKRKMISEGTSSFEACLLLESISPSTKEPLSPDHHYPGEKQKCGLSRHKLSSAIYSFVVGMLCILLMISLLCMYAEAFGWFVEVCVVTVLGAIINASYVARYVMFTFWVVLYSTTVYNRVYNKYARMNKQLFKFIESKLSEDIKHVNMIQNNNVKNTGYKYFSQADVRDRLQHINMYEDSDDETPITKPNKAKKAQPQQKGPHGLNHQDTIDYQSQKLHWSIHSLVLFVDKYDVARIPEELFNKVCKVKAPGCPGPIYKSFFLASKQLFVMTIFLLFILFIVVYFGDMADMTSTNQLLVILMAGFLPYAIVYVLNWRKGHSELSSLTFHGKIHQIIMDFNQSWPVYDLSFVREYPLEGRGFRGASGAQGGIKQGLVCETTVSTTHNGPDVVDPTHVDLLITIRDDKVDDGYENLRSEHGSFGSRGSLNSGGHNNSPDDPGYATMVMGSTRGDGGAFNRPSNAMQHTQLHRAALNDASNASPGGGSAHGPLSRHHSPSQASLGSHGKLNTPPPRVDLVVDLSKGVGVHVAQAQTQTENSKNGIPMWAAANANKDNAKGIDKDTESEL